MSEQVYRPDLVEASTLRAQGQHVNACPVQHPEGWLCTLPVGHDGDEHAAGTYGGWFAVIWTYRMSAFERAMVVKCPNCQAQPGEPCTQPTDTGRRAVKRPHLARLDALDG